ncbi:MAG: DUF4180 domain-containing protein [Bacteroidales bacterium]|nr:DUF4180 domain-containing protein [Bacteroidales bacterium]MCB9013958.1 DUF4180 domain-containing protein [Bacteroidales bacterium]
MEIKITELQDKIIAQPLSDSQIIVTVQDSLDLMADCSYKGAEVMILYDYNFTPRFFDLSTGLAGEILQKFSTYSMSLVIIGDFGKYPSKNLKSFIFESNKTGRINFMPSLEVAFQKIMAQ